MRVGYGETVMLIKSVAEYCASAMALTWNDTSSAFQPDTAKLRGPKVDWASRK